MDRDAGVGPEVIVEGADLVAIVELAPPDTEPDEYGIRLIADVTIEATADTVARIRVLGIDRAHCAMVVIRGEHDEDRRLVEFDPLTGGEIDLAAGERLHLTIVTSLREDGMAILANEIAQGGFGGGGEAEADFETEPAPPPPPPTPAPGGRQPTAGERREAAAPEAPAPGEAEPGEAGPGEAVQAQVLGEMPARLRRGVESAIVVHLSREKILAAAGMAFGQAVVPVDAARDIRIEVSLRGLRFAAGQDSAVDVRLPGAGAPQLDIPFRVVPVDEGTCRAFVAVSQPPVFAPIATFNFSSLIVGADDDVDDPGPVTAEGTVTPVPEDLAKLPTIAVSEALAGRSAVLRITVAVGGTTATHTVEVDKLAFIDGVYGEVTRIREELGTKRDRESVARAERALRAVGVGVARELLGGPVGALLWRRRAKLANIVVQSSTEVDIPWEIVHLVPPDDDTPDDRHTNFLGDKGLTRWVYDTARPTTLPLRPARVVTAAPEYADPRLQLARTREEVTDLRRQLGDEGRTARTPAELSALLAAGKVDLVHFAGHGRWRDQAPTGQEIAFADFAEAHDDGSASYRDTDARRDLPELARPEDAASTPVVFLSACDVGRLRAGATGLGGFAEAFLRGGAGVFIGCSWAVQDDAASSFVRTFYKKAVSQGMTLGEATLLARRAAHRAGDLNALAFTVFADPRARFVRQ